MLPPWLGVLPSFADGPSDYSSGLRVFGYSWCLFWFSMCVRGLVLLGKHHQFDGAVFSDSQFQCVFQSATATGLPDRLGDGHPGAQRYGFPSGFHVA